jgi:hypothetical protein
MSKSTRKRSALILKRIFIDNGFLLSRKLLRDHSVKILGRALYCVRSNPNLVWMFLSENVDAFVRSEEEEEEASNSEVPVAVAAAVVVELAGCKRKC